MSQAFAQLDAAAYDGLSEHIRALHERIHDIAPDVQRIACALYDPTEDLLKTFINSTREGEALRGYEYRMSDSYSLSKLAASGEFRVLSDLPEQVDTQKAHSQWVLEMGYKSSLTLPMTYQEHFLGFLFFDSDHEGTFTPELTRELMLYGRLITLAVANELILIRSILGSVQVARDFTELRDLETGAHLERMSRYAHLIARDVAEANGKDDEWVESVFLYAPLHDIGKIGIPDHILLKPGKLDPDEWEVMKTHTTKGVEMVEAITRQLGLPNANARTVVRNIVELHHEALDGSGYPHGLRGEDIPLEARVVAVADVFDALTSERHYKPAWTFDNAFEELQRMADSGKLDPRIVGILLAHRDDAVRISSRYQEQATA